MNAVVDSKTIILRSLAKWMFLSIQVMTPELISSTGFFTNLLFIRRNNSTVDALNPLLGNIAEFDLHQAFSIRILLHIYFYFLFMKV